MPKIVHMQQTNIMDGKYNHVSSIQRLLQADTAYILPVGKNKCCIYTLNKKQGDLEVIWYGWDTTCPTEDYEKRTLYLLPYQSRQRVDPIYCFNAAPREIALMVASLFPALHVHVTYGVGNSTTRVY